MTEASQDPINRLPDTAGVPECDRLRAILTATTAAVVVLDDDGRIVFATHSTAHILGWDQGQLTDRPLTLTDCTDKVQAERQHRRTETRPLEAQKLESLGVLAGGVAHDFNNLLTAILGNAALARCEPHLTASLLTCLDQIESVSHRAADLCQQLLAFAGKGRYQMAEVNLTTLVQGMAQLLQRSAGKKAALLLHLADDLPAVYADAVQLRQAVLNLVLNASEALGEQAGTITLRTGVRSVDRAFLAATHLGDPLPEGEYVFLEVVDKGCGMTEETLARIFDPFFSTKFTGRGLGLAAVLGIVRGHRGALQVTSTPRQGSTFLLLLPYASVACLRPGRRTLDAGRG